MILEFQRGFLYNFFPMTSSGISPTSMTSIEDSSRNFYSNLFENLSLNLYYNFCRSLPRSCIKDVFRNSCKNSSRNVPRITFVDSSNPFLNLKNQHSLEFQNTFWIIPSCLWELPYFSTSEGCSGFLRDCPEK